VPPDVRTAIVLRCFGGGSNIDIGAALGVHSATVYRALWDEALCQTVKFERNCHLAEPPSDASPGGVIRTHRAI